MRKKRFSRIILVLELTAWAQRSDVNDGYPVFITDLRLNEDQAMPEGLVGVAPTAAGNDGRITGTTAAMEYKLAAAGDEDYAACSDTATGGLTAGDYLVRYAAKTGFNAGEAVLVNVPAYTPPSDRGGGTSDEAENEEKVVNTTEDGMTVATLIVDEQTLKKRLEAEGNHAALTISLDTGADIAAVRLNGRMVRNMETKDATLVIETNSATFTLPAAQININAVAEQFGQNINLSDVEVQIQIGRLSDDAVKVVENAAAAGEFSIMVPAVDFTISCTYHGRDIRSQ